MDKITVAICNYNTPDLLAACIASAKKHIKGFLPQFVVLDNSDKVKLDAHNEIFNDVQILDNTEGTYIDFKKIVNTFGKSFDETYGSLKHAYSIQWLLNSCQTDKMILLDSDVIIKRDLDFFACGYAGAFDISQRKTYKPRALPYVQLFNVNFLKTSKLIYFDPTRIRGGTVQDNSSKYDTGASYLEDIKNKKLKFKQIDFSDYVYHLRSASFSPCQQNQFLERYSQYWKNVASLDENLQYKLIVSLTSWSPRIQDGSLQLTLESLLKQKFNGKFKIVVTLTKADKDLLDLQLIEFINQHGIEILIADENLKSHKKYFYVMKKWKQLPIVTVDDDVIYEPDVIQSLYNSYKEFPHAVSACRTHLMQRNSHKHLLSYRQWKYEYKELKKYPSFDLFATGVGGVLYPENCLQISDTDLLNIKECLNADDIFLKKKEQMLGIQTVFVPLDDGMRSPYRQQKSSIAPYALCFTNNTRTRCDNDIYISKIQLI